MCVSLGLCKPSAIATITAAHPTSGTAALLREASAARLSIQRQSADIPPCSSANRFAEVCHMRLIAHQSGVPCPYPAPS